ncbi:MAG: efflux RND transporter periplasmic adaptor subunit [Phycisphaerales bacterium]|nr:efflux RND transporter periplasmic adaptor subunit [Phycisphaerales bacterium]
MRIRVDRQTGRLPRARRAGAPAASLTILGFLIVVAVLMLWLVGGFRTRIKPGLQNAKPPAAVSGETVAVRQISLPRVETAVGTIEPVHRVEVAARILARIVEMNVVAGQKVRQGDVLVRLDDADLASRVRQAEAAFDSAVATRDQAKIEEARTRDLIARESASPIEHERNVTALKTAEAGVLRAQQSLEEARTVLAFATIVSPITGVVVDKRANVGDTASPGQVLVTLLDPERMQLVAPVRETLSRRLKVGQTIDVSLEILDHPCAGTISEIVPEADPASRSFAVKVTGECPDGVYAGMFGRLLIPLDDEDVLVIPRAAVQSVGQLDIALVQTPQGQQRRTLRLGRQLGSDVEVLAGLKAGEQVVIAKSGGN